MRKFFGRIAAVFKKTGKELCRPAVRRWTVRVLGMCVALGMILGGMALCISAAVCDKVKDKILTVEALAESGNGYDCVLVLGCRVYEDGRLSAMLRDRVLTGVAVINSGVTDRMVMSGDHRTDAYNEVDAMKAFAKEQGIASEQIFLDHDGYSTYESILRIKQVFGAKRIVIVTQEYHLSRALYLAEKLGMEAVGVSADLQSYSKQAMRELREIAARCKDVYLGAKQPAVAGAQERVNLFGNGDCTAQSRPYS